MATPRDALSDAQARWNAADLDGYLELYDERTVLHGYAPEAHGQRHRAARDHDPALRRAAAWSTASRRPTCSA